MITITKETIDLMRKLTEVTNGKVKVVCETALGETVCKPKVKT